MSSKYGTTLVEHLQRLDDCTEFVDDDRILKREEVACLRQVFPLQHLKTQQYEIQIIVAYFLGSFRYSDNVNDLLKKLVHGGSVC